MYGTRGKVLQYTDSSSVDMPSDKFLTADGMRTYFPLNQLYACMVTGVTGERVLTGETSGAQLTLVRFLPSVNTGVSVQVTPLQKRRIAYVADERLFARVREDVPVHITLVSKRRFADGAAKWLFTCVNSSVPVQATLLRKRLLADRADERFCTSVNANVSVQMASL